MMNMMRPYYIRKMSNINEVVGKNNNEIIKFGDSDKYSVDLYALNTNKIGAKKS